MSVASVIATQRSRVRRVYRGWWIVVISYYTQLITAGAGGWVFGVLILSMQQDLGWKQTAITWVLTQTRIISAVLSVPLGSVVDKHGARLLMSVSAAVAGIGMILVAFSNSPLTFYAAWMLYGIAQPGVGLLGPRVAISNWFVRKRAQAFVWFTLGSATAGIIAAPVAAWIDVRYGWRLVWVILGLMSLSVTPLAWAAIRRRPEDVGLLPDGDSPADVAARVASRVASGVREVNWTVREALRTRSFWLITLGFLMVSMPGGAIFINISAFVQTQGYDRAFGAFTVAVYGGGVFFGRPTWGFFLPRVGLYRTMVIFAVIYSVSIAIFALQPGSNLPFVRDIRVFGLDGIQIQLLLTTIWLGIAISGLQLLNAQALPDYYGREIVGRLTGFQQVTNVAIGGSAPLLTAFVFDTTGGYVPAFLFFAAACVVAAAAFFFSPPPVHPSEREPAAKAPAVAA